MTGLFKEVQQLKIKSASDNRGKFVKFFDSSLLDQVNFEMKQQNYVHTNEAFTVRGLHYQTNEAAEAKIFRVLSGSIQLGIFDTRKGSPTFEKSDALTLSQIEEAYFIPRGFATGYLTLLPNTVVLYMSDNHYMPEFEKGIRPNDPVLTFQWANVQMKMSEKDQQWPDWK